MLERATGNVVILASQVSADSPKDPGSVINYANDLDIAQDGTVYFTTSCDIPVVPNALGFWDTFAVFILTTLQVRSTSLNHKSVQASSEQKLLLLHSLGCRLATCSCFYTLMLDVSGVASLQIGLPLCPSLIEVDMAA